MEIKKGRNSREYREVKVKKKKEERDRRNWLWSAIIANTYCIEWEGRGV